VVMGVRILLLMHLLPVPIDLPVIGVVRPRGSRLRFACRGGPPSRTSHGAMVEGPRLVVTGYLLPCIGLCSPSVAWFGKLGGSLE
jgi:hypothetical protein